MSAGGEDAGLILAPPSGLAVDAVADGIVLSTRRSPTWRLATGAVGVATLALHMPVLTGVVALVLGLSLLAQPR